MRHIVPARATRHQLRRAFHGHILGDISEQVQVYDPESKRFIRYAKLAWKILFARQFLEPQFDEHDQLIDPPSTETISDDAFRAFLQRVCSFAARDLKVTFLPKDHPR